MGESVNGYYTTEQCRSVFVANIPYELTEEKLKDIFTAVGPVQAFKLALDPETGEPTNYGFCVYKDACSALRAIKYMNGIGIGGRAIRVDNVSTEKRRMEMESLLSQGQNTENPSRIESVQADAVPAAISRAVALLPEKIFEHMKEITSFAGNSRTDRFPVDPMMAATANSAPVAAAPSIVDTTASTGTSSTSSNSERLMAGTSSPGNIPLGATDHEIALLIMQVLQLSDQQIAMLPLDQRQSILILKDQITKRIRQR